MDDGFDIDVTRLKEMRDEGATFFLLDVRTPMEHGIARIEGATLIPLQELPQRIAELPREGPIVVHCHHGGRSAQAVEYLRRLGFEETRNLDGGIDAWSLEIDPSVPRY